jgi:hypothetical protein
MRGVNVAGEETLGYAGGRCVTGSAVGGSVVEQPGRGVRHESSTTDSSFTERIRALMFG